MNISAMVSELNVRVDYEGDGASFEISVRGVFRKRPACLTKNSRGCFRVGFDRIVSYFVRWTDWGMTRAS